MVYLSSFLNRVSAESCLLRIWGTWELEIARGKSGKLHYSCVYILHIIITSAIPVFCCVTFLISLELTSISSNTLKTKTICVTGIRSRKTSLQLQATNCYIKMLLSSSTLITVKTLLLVLPVVIVSSAFLLCLQWQWMLVRERTWCFPAVFTVAEPECLFFLFFFLRSLSTHPISELSTESKQ